jgi:putative endonuclease
MSRRRREVLGRLAEAVAALCLRLKGYRILARRWRTPVGEIDLVARRGDLVAFVEVKARATRLDALEAITPGQRHRVEQAAALFLQHHPQLASCRLRFDVIAVCPGRLPHHLSGAWRGDGIPSPSRRNQRLG